MQPICSGHNCEAESVEVSYTVHSHIKSETKLHTTWLPSPDGQNIRQPVAKAVASSWLPGGLVKLIYTKQ